MATAAPTATGRVIQITGPVVDIEFPAGQLPAIYNAVEIVRAGPRPARLRGPAAPRQQLGPRRGHDHDGRPGPRRPRSATPAPRSSVPVGAGRRSAASSTCWATRSTRRARSTAARSCRSTAPRPPFDEQTTEIEVFETGHQGHRPDLPLHEGRQDRHLRRRRRRQDGHHPGADPQRRPGARGLLGVRRRRRAVARGQRPDQAR